MNKTETKRFCEAQKSFVFIKYIIIYHMFLFYKLLLLVNCLYIIVFESLWDGPMAVSLWL